MGARSSHSWRSGSSGVAEEAARGLLISWLQRRRRYSGVSLLELLVVLAITGILLGLLVYAFDGHQRRRKFDEELSALTTLLEQARQYALVHQAPVWVAFHEPAAARSSSGEKGSLLVAMVSTRDGTRSTGAGNTLELVPESGTFMVAAAPIQEPESEKAPATNLDLLASPLKLSRVKLISAGADHSGPAFSVLVPGQSERSVFSRVIEFGPQGQARTVEFSPEGIACNLESSEPIAQGRGRQYLGRNLWIDPATGQVRLEAAK
jgi:type II secretory pathway pseudopilin PulG